VWQPPGRTEACAAWTKAEASTEVEAGSGGEVMAEAADAAKSSEEAAATPTTNYNVDAFVLHCILEKYSFFCKKPIKIPARPTGYQ
jgi:hypothetical protein